jgi:hypothetical protein
VGTGRVVVHCSPFSFLSSISSLPKGLGRRTLQVEIFAYSMLVFLTLFSFSSFQFFRSEGLDKLAGKVQNLSYGHLIGLAQQILGIQNGSFTNECK